MPTGTVTRVFETKGFGYITPDDGDRDLLMQVDAATLAHFTNNSRVKSQPNGHQGDTRRKSRAPRSGPAVSGSSKLREGTRVQFEIEDSDVGLHAVAVAPLG